MVEWGQRPVAVSCRREEGERTLYIYQWHQRISEASGMFENEARSHVSTKDERCLGEMTRDAVTIDDTSHVLQQT